MQAWCKQCDYETRVVIASHKQNNKEVNKEDNRDDVNWNSSKRVPQSSKRQHTSTPDFATSG